MKPCGDDCISLCLDFLLIWKLHYVYNYNYREFAWTFDISLASQSHLKMKTNPKISQKKNKKNNL